MRCSLALLALAPLCACATPAEIARLRREAPAAEPTRVLELQHAEAQDVARALQQVFADRQGPTLRVAAVPRSKRILLAGSPGALAEAEAVVARLDAQRAWRTELLELEHAHAGKLAEALRRALPGVELVSYGDRMLLASGSAEDLEPLQALVSRLDRSPAAAQD